jgi:hypothetical protein
MNRLRNSVLTFPLLFALALPATAQHRDDNYYKGVRQGGHGGQYYDNRHDDRRYTPPPKGGIGPGKGALIGGAAGGALGAVFGGGLKGAIVGGAAGAGIGAIAGQANQNSKRNDYYRH